MSRGQGGPPMPPTPPVPPTAPVPHAALEGFGIAAASDQIQVVGIRAIGRHGVLAVERFQGQEFVVDVVIHTDLTVAARTDDLAATVDYAAVAKLVEAHIVGPPVALIETLAEAIAVSLLALDRVHAVDVRVHKPHAPIPVTFRDVSVSIRRQS